MKSSVATVLTFIATLSGCIDSSGPKAIDGQTVLEGEKNTFATIDGLSRQEARDIAFRMGWVDDDNKPYDDYDVEVYYGGPVVGSLVEGKYGNLINSTACKPKILPASTSINVFSSYEITGNLALQLGLPIPNVPLGLKAGRELTSSYSLEGAQLTLLTRDEVDDLLRSPPCKARVKQAQGRLWIVRGLISAKRIYKFYRKTSAGAKLSIPGSDNSLSNEGTYNGSGTDADSRVYFMILKPVPAIAPVRPAVPIDATDPRDPCSSVSGNKIYIQRDATGMPAAAIAIREALGARFNVVRGIEAIDHDRMPSTPQVRYFNEPDKIAADCVVKNLQASGYGRARSVFLKKLSAPSAQLEVWLTRTP